MARPRTFTVPAASNRVRYFEADARGSLAPTSPGPFTGVAPTEHGKEAS